MSFPLINSTMKSVTAMMMTAYSPDLNYILIFY